LDSIVVWPEADLRLLRTSPKRQIRDEPGAGGPKPLHIGLLVRCFISFCFDRTAAATPAFSVLTRLVCRRQEPTWLAAFGA
jgi:hypothetical protein